MRAPLDLLLSKKKFKNLSDEKVEKLCKLSTLTFTTWYIDIYYCFQKADRLRGVEKQFKMLVFTAAAIVLKPTPIWMMMTHTLQQLLQVMPPTLRLLNFYLVPHLMASSHLLRQCLQL